MAAVLKVEGLGKSFGRRQALVDIDLSLGEGEILAVTGPNGAGKTTLLNLLATLTRMDSGTIEYFGLPLRGNENDIRRRIGFVSHQTMLYNDLTARENLLFFARLYQLDHAQERVMESLQGYGMEGKAQQTVKTLSRGMQQRLTILRALLHDPALLLLDEPFSHLDQESAQKFAEMLAERSKCGIAIVFASHDLNLVSRVGQRAVLLSRGHIAALWNSQELKSTDLGSHYAAFFGKQQAGA